MLILELGYSREQNRKFLKLKEIVLDYIVLGSNFLKYYLKGFYFNRESSKKWGEILFYMII